MIATILRTHWTNLKRDRTALLVTFLVPLGFFSIFAMIFGGMSAPMGKSGASSGMRSIRVLAADLDDSKTSRGLLEALDRQEGVEVERAPRAGADEAPLAPYDRDSAHAAVRAGRAPVALVIPVGFSDRFGDFVNRPEAIELLYDASNPMAPQAVAGMLQGAAMQAAPTRLMDQGFNWLSEAGGGLTDEQAKAIEEARTYVQADAQPSSGTDGVGGMTGLVEVKNTDVRETDEPRETARSFPMIAYNASGIAVMFLLFSMAGVGGVLLDDQDRGTLERLLISPLGMNRLLMGNWLFAFLLGMAQVVLMFLLAALAFGLELFTLNRLVGFGLVTTAMAAAGAAFGMVLATLCKTRAQLNGLSTLVILLMSAAGGSMVPRFLMPEFMETTALFTFNGWALDGYLKVFWYDTPGATLMEATTELMPQLAVLALMALAFLALARLLARRWETA